MEKNVVVGLMSGTSLDGLDLVCAEFYKEEKSWKFNIQAVESLEYDTELLLKVKQAISTKGKDVHSLHTEFGKWLGKCVKNFIKKNELRVDLVSSHGQTIYHDPAKEISIQVGDGQEIATLCGIPVVSDFRQSDVKMGGQGAPLVPIGDLLLFPEFKYCLNLGGIANISHKKDGIIKAFDVCICNAGANYFSEMKGFPYDDKGSMACSGSIDRELLNKWNELDYFKQSPPKSLDASFFENEMLPFVSSVDCNTSDCLRTLVEHISLQLSAVIENKSEPILVTGGGAYNDFLIQNLVSHFGMNIVLPESKLIEFKEALIFAFMGYLKWNGMDNVLSTVTGAPKNHSSGLISLPQPSI